MPECLKSSVVNGKLDEISISWWLKNPQDKDEVWIWNIQPKMKNKLGKGCPDNQLTIL